MRIERRRGVGAAVWLSIIVMAVLILTPVTAEAKQPKPPKHAVQLEIEGSSGHPFDSEDAADFPMMVRSGWTLTLQARPGLEYAGYGKPAAYPNYPAMETTHPWLFGEPLFGSDGCPSWVEFQFADAWEGCEVDGTPNGDPWPVDEKLMSFTPGVSMAQECPPFSPVEDCEFYQTIAAVDWQDASVQIDARIGPYLGTAYDGYGYGASWRFPGLVLTADAGVGVVVDTAPPFDRTGECRNLAGFLNTVSYVLSDRFYRSEVTAHMAVPDGLFTPVVHVDETAGDECGASDSFSDVLYKIDGWPLGEPACSDGGSYLFMKNIAAERLITLRAFVVQVDAEGKGPDGLWDWDFDGDCDADDAEGLGWQVLSGEEVLRFSLYFEDNYTNVSEELDVLRWDWNMDGFVPGIVAPGGSGGLVGPPR